ncbi:MAG: DUF1501 domain-containing protein [Pseudomonadota bacterium]
MTSRRRFLSHSCRLGVASATLSSSLLQLGLARNAAAASAGGDYRALVCVLLAGGNDSFNMVVPNDADQYGEYSAIRSDLALGQDTLLPLAGTAANGRSYALHPGMPEVAQLYESRELAIIANVGTLIEPVDFTNIETARLPLGLFSHSDQIAQWQTAVPNARVAQGWGGRIADLLADVNAANGISMNISLGGTNLFQSGVEAVEYAISSEDFGAVSVNGYNDGTPFGSFRKRILDAILDVPHENLLRNEYRQRLRSSIDSAQVFTEALLLSERPATAFSDGPFSQALRQIARVIAAREQLGATRQTFFVQVGGWDHHDEVLNNQAQMLPAISVGLREFRDALVEIGVFDQVTTFTTSDFGRTLTSNGKGSDHGWGGHHYVMGGAVTGGELYGEYPLLAMDSPLDVGRGIYIPTTSIDSYFAELALWLGVAPGDLATVLPNVRSFYTPESGVLPLGFLS